MDAQGHETGLYESLAAALPEWDGSAAGADFLLENVKRLPARVPKLTSISGKAVALARSLLDSREPRKVLNRLRNDPELAHTFSPFVGQECFGSWPFHRPFDIPDEEAVAWASVLKAGAYPNQQLNDFLFVFFHARRRSLWIPASTALGHLSVRNPSLTEFLVECWRRSFPHGLPNSLPAGRLVSEDPREDFLPGEKEHSVHVARHVLHAVCVFVAAGGKEATLEGFSPERLTQIPLTRVNETDASAMLLALGELAAVDATLDRIRGPLHARIAECPRDEQCEAALRGLAERTRDDGEELRSAAEKRLIQTVWMRAEGSKRMDLLWSWLETAAWLKKRDCLLLVEEMKAHSEEARPLLELVLDGKLPQGASEPLPAVLKRLRTLFDRDFAATTTLDEKALAVVEVLLLFEEPSVSSLPWRSILARALGSGTPAGTLEGTVSEAGRPSLLLQLASQGEAPAVLLRERVLGEDIVLELAAAQNGMLARQVAVQTERILRQSDSHEDQIRFLWRLLQRNPPSSTFRELKSVLRWHPDAMRDGLCALRAIVDAIGNMDTLRDDQRANTRPVAEYLARISVGYVQLAEAVSGYLDSSPARPETLEARNPVSLLRQLSSAIAQLPGITAENPPGDLNWLDAAKVFLAPWNVGGTADKWATWCEAPSANLPDAWPRFESAIRDLPRGTRSVSADSVREFAEAILTIRDAIPRLAWPEREIVECLLAQAADYLADCRGFAERGENITKHVSAALARGDEDTAVQIVSSRPEELPYLHPEHIRHLYLFLLERFLFLDARIVWVRCADVVQIPHVRTYLGPLLFGAAGGVLLVLDVGTAWNEVVPNWRSLPFFMTVAVALLGSLGLLTSSLLRKLSPENPRQKGGGRALFLKALRRSLPVYALTLALSLLISAFALWSLEGTSLRRYSPPPQPPASMKSGVLLGQAPLGSDPRGPEQEVPLVPQLVLWASLSHFLGLFVGLILQGREFTTGE